MKCYVGVDLGTARSGYAYAFSSEPASIKHPPRYTSQDETGATKTDTALLFEVMDAPGPHGQQQWRLDCWGTAAHHKYTTDLFGSEGSRYRLVTGKQFKLALEKDPQQLPPDCQLPQDCPYSAAELVTIMLQCLKDHAQQELLQSVGFDIRSNDVHYCLSVPAGWSLKAKRIMHYAAEQAGMTLSPRHSRSSSNGSASTSSSSDRSHQARDQQQQQQSFSMHESASAVVLIHEQEAAALSACIDPMQDMPTHRAIPGQVWVTLDAGGGTVDIAMHQIEASKHKPNESHLAERLRSRCLLLGSRMLDAQAEQYLLRPLFGAAAAAGAYERWQQEDPQSYMSQMRDWEDVKRRWDGESTEHLKLDYGLLERLPSNAPGVQRGRLVISAEDMQHKVFEPIIAPILEQLRQMLTTPLRKQDRAQGADILVLAGGFGSSPYLHKRLAQEFSSCLRQPPIRPNNASKAVLMGNTIHLQRPDAIRARVSRLTYGLNVGDHPKDGCRTAGRCIQDRKGRTWCETHFRPLVRIHDLVQVGESSQPFAVYPLPDADVVHVPIFATEATDASHTTEPGMQRIGVLSVGVNKARKYALGLIKAGRQSSDDYKIELSFRFGCAEVEVHAFDVTNKCSTKVDFIFSSEPAGAEHNWRVDLPGVDTKVVSQTDRSTNNLSL